MSQYYMPYADEKFWNAYDDDWDEQTQTKAKRLQNRRWKLIRELRDY